MSKNNLISISCGLIVLLLLYYGCKNSQPEWQLKKAPLMTRWAKEVLPHSVLPEYPRPQMVRREWINLNGLWDLGLGKLGDSSLTHINWTGKIMVPFPIESALSGVMEKAECIWYRRYFNRPPQWHDQNILLHFGAVDWETEIFINGKRLGMHRGGYDAFSFDITAYLVPDEKQELIVRVYDPTDRGIIARGKQVDKPGGIFYTSTTGIWQTVWLEPVPPQAYIRGFHINTDIKEKSVLINVDIVTPSAAEKVDLVARAGEKILGRATGLPGEDIILQVPEARLWTPQKPILYDLEIALLSGDQVVDKIESYFGLRKISIGQDEHNISRILLNDEFQFQIGMLDQGFWPDGLYTAPTDDALRFDIETAKKLGFNLLRKHVKIEPQRWYYWCDKLGMLVWQDMPSFHPGDLEQSESKEFKQQFETELRKMVTDLYNHPAIIMWVIFNEGWGQYDTDRLTAMVQAMDQSRLVNNASGWADMKVGNVIDIHAYPGPEAPKPDQERAAVLGEFGGLGLALPQHTWTIEHWGYQNMVDFKNLRDRYERLLDNVWKLKVEPGLSAAVYTQITDVETETNGLITYDRQVIKLDEKDATLFNRDEMISPPVILPATSLFLNDLEVTITNRKGEAIRYTLDGSEPTSTARVYSGPIPIDTTTILKACSFGKMAGSSATVQAKFEKVSPLPAVILERSPVAGLRYQYFEGNWNQLPDFDTLTFRRSGVTSRFDLSNKQRDDLIGLRFSGYIKVLRDGVYTFYTRSDDGSRLYVAGKRVVENDGLHGMQEQSGQIALQQGYHPLELGFFEKSGDQGLEVFYAGPMIKKQEVPAYLLFHRE